MPFAVMASRPMLRETIVPMSYFWRAIRTSPAYLAGYLLFLLSLLGSRPLQYAILKRRELAGNQLGIRSGTIGSIKNRASINTPVRLVPTDHAICDGGVLPANYEDTAAKQTPRQKELACSKF